MNTYDLYTQTAKTETARRLFNAAAHRDARYQARLIAYAQKLLEQPRPIRQRDQWNKHARAWLILFGYNRQEDEPAYTLTPTRADSVLISSPAGYYHGAQYINYLEVSAETDYTDNFRSLDDVPRRQVTEFRYRLLSRPDDTLARWTAYPQHNAPTSAIIDAENFIRDEILRLNGLVELAHRESPIYRLMLEESADYDKPRLFVTDMTWHDALMAYDAPPAFIWTIRESGTHFLTPHTYDPMSGTPNYQLDYNRAAINQESRNKTAQFYLCRTDPARIEQIEPARALKIIDSNFRNL